MVYIWVLLCWNDKAKQFSLSNLLRGIYSVNVNCYNTCESSDRNVVVMSKEYFGEYFTDYFIIN